MHVNVTTNIHLYPDSGFVGGLLTGIGRSAIIEIGPDVTLFASDVETLDRLAEAVANARAALVG